MKRRSGFTVMARLIGLVRPLTGFMVLAVAMGLIGHLLATFITILGGYAVLRLLALIRDKVFRALRRLCPVKLEGRDKGDLISIITSDIELLEVFYAHTITLLRRGTGWLFPTAGKRFWMAYRCRFPKAA